MYDVSSWFQEKLEDRNSSPFRRFTIGTSDYSDRATSWPVIRRTSNQVQATKVSIPLDNHDGQMNVFQEQVYMLANSGTLEFGYWEPPLPRQVVVDGGFDQPLAWLGVDPWAVVSGEARALGSFFGNDTNGYLVQRVLTPGQRYQLEVDVRSIAFQNSSYLQFWFGNQWKTTEIWTGDGHYTYYGVSTGTTAAAAMFFWIYSSSNWIGTVDNVRVTECSCHELITLYSGWLKTVSYNDRKAKVTLYDRLWYLADKVVGDTSSETVTFSHEIPSDIAWTLLTCYGGYDTVESTSNPDIDYEYWQNWANVFSGDSVVMSTRYTGQKVMQAITDLCKMSDSVVWVSHEGKVRFKKFAEPDSLDLTYTDDHITGLKIDVESLRLINKAYIYWDYAPESNYWPGVCFRQNTLSVNTFDLHEEIWKSQYSWFVDSVSALGQASRFVEMLGTPPRRFDLKTTLAGIRSQLGETIRFTDSFFNATSASGWRAIEQEINMDTGELRWRLDEAAVMNGFYLDVSSLGADDLLL